ncbi:MAG TPA: PAS domain S-box protein, partial [Terracidiphilus sp.]
MRSNAEANLLALIDSTEDMWGSVDLDYRMVVFNQNFERYIQASLGVKIEVGMNPADLLSPERAATWPLIYQRALQQGPYRTEYTLLDGRIYEIAVHPVLMDGKPTGVSVYGRDITSRKQIESQLKDSEERYRSTFEQAAIGIVHTSFDGRWMRCNPRFTEIVGYTQEELVGKDFQQFTHPEDVAEGARTLQQMSSGQLESACLEKRYQHKDGRWVWVELTISILRDGQGQPLHIIAFVEDITRRKESDKILEVMTQTLQSSERRYRTAFQTCLDCFAIIRISDGVFIDINQAFVEIMGFDRDEVVGRRSNELNIWVEPRELDELLQIMRRDSVCRNFEAQFRRKNGQRFIGRMSVSAIELDGQICHLAMVRDVSEAKAAEESLIAASEALRLTEERYRTAFETSLDPICIVRLSDGVFIDVNSAYLECLLYRREEVIGRSSEELGVWVSRQDRQRLREKLIRSSSCKGLETQFRKKNGDTFWGQLSASAIEINGVT